MKKKIFIISAIVGILVFVAVFATKAKAECYFFEGNNLYVCVLDGAICDSAHTDCQGIKILALPGPPKPIDPINP